MSRHVLDAQRLLCPLPVIKVQDKVGTLESGDVLEVLCSDPGAVNDIPAWCRVNGHRVLNIDQADRCPIRILIEVV